MIPVNIKVLGISGTPIKDGNCDTMVQEALKTAAEIEGVETEFITMAGKRVALCQHCQWCIENRSPCKIKDYGRTILNKMIEADGIILGAPTWNVKAAPLINMLISRWRYYHFFTYEFGKKIVGVLTVGFLNEGLEGALYDLEILGRGAGPVVARGWACASTAAFGQRPKYLEHGVLDDPAGMARVRNVATKVVEFARMIRYAIDSGVELPDEYKRTFRGARVKEKEKKIFVNGIWRNKQ
jgi:multimeric flavodoxin WrbA